MSKTISLLQNVQIASPCSAKWDQMTGDEKTRFCHQCKLNVHNLSAMTTTEAETLLSNSTGRLCARIYRRTDGTILTQDCPVGLAAVRRKMRLMIGRIAAVFTFLLAGVSFARYSPERGSQTVSIGALPGFRTVKRWMNDTPPTPIPVRWTMGVFIANPPANNGNNIWGSVSEDQQIQVVWKSDNPIQ